MLIISKKNYFYKCLNKKTNKKCNQFKHAEEMNINSACFCLFLDPESFSHTLRLFHMTSVSGVFEAHEILNPSRSPDLPTKFPFLQTELYAAQQPALFLIDNGHEVYLWQVGCQSIG